MYKVVPAGSVYYFRLKDNRNLLDFFNYQSIVKIENFKKEGYGICVVGNVKEIK